MLMKTRGIVFRKVKYGETSLIVDVFTEEHGLMSYIISGVRSAKARTGSVLMQLMAIVEIVAYHSDKSKLHRIREAHAAYIFEHIPGDVRKNAIILFMAELCSKSIRMTEKHPALFTLISEEIMALDQAQGDFADAHLLFMIRLADLLGFGPAERDDPQHTIFDLLEGHYTTAQPDHTYYITNTDLFNKYLIAARDRSQRVSADRMHRNRILDTLLLYYQLHMDKMPEMHAHRVLREIL